MQSLNLCDNIIGISGVTALQNCIGLINELTLTCYDISLDTMIPSGNMILKKSMQQYIVNGVSISINGLFFLLEASHQR